jgi:divalent metal cation (Fe/Co/Zn/Cd) transporter
MSVELAPSMRRPLSAARLAQAVTVAWMLIEGVIAVGAGVVAHSVALTAFGFDSFIELFSAAVCSLPTSWYRLRPDFFSGCDPKRRLSAWA